MLIGWRTRVVLWTTLHEKYDEYYTMAEKIKNISESASMEWTPERIERFWDYISSRHTEYFTNQLGGIMVHRFRPWLKGRYQILDFGCGPGFLIGHILREFQGESKEIFGADMSEDSLATLNMR